MPDKSEPTGRRPSPLSAATQKALTTLHIWLYRGTRGRIGGWMFNGRILLLTTTGRKSGRRHTIPLLCLQDALGPVLVASNGGTARPPAWWLNLQAHPAAEVEIMGTRKHVTARDASPAEKQRLWPLVVAMYPGYAGYQRITNRDIPLVILSESK